MADGSADEAIMMKFQSLKECLIGFVKGDMGVLIEVWKQKMKVDAFTKQVAAKFEAENTVLTNGEDQDNPITRINRKVPFHCM